MFFYYETRERLAVLGSAPALSFAGLGVQIPAPEEEGAANVIESQSDVEREAREFMEENELLLNEGGISTLQKIYLLQGTSENSYSTHLGE
jgi:hypothetical protein